MARKATDMLDVFRTRKPEPARGTSGARAPEGSAKAGFPGLVLLPRQIVLGSSVVVLLVVFAFVLGLRVGRPEAGSAHDAALARTTARDPNEPRYTYIEARVPYMDPALQVANDPAKLREKLIRTKGVPQDKLKVLDDVASQGLRIVIGPFPSAEVAAEYLRLAGLFTFKLGGVLPWKNPTYPARAASELPAGYLPK